MSLLRVHGRGMRVGVGVCLARTLVLRTLALGRLKRGLAITRGPPNDVTNYFTWRDKGFGWVLLGN